MEHAIRKEFVKRVLQEEGQKIKKAQLLAISKLLQFRSGYLTSNRDYTVKQSGEMDGQLTITHPAYERFLDIKKKQKVSDNTKQFRKRNKTKSYPIHNRIIFGHYSAIASKLMHHLTDDVKQSIKEDLQISNKA